MNHVLNLLLAGAAALALAVAGELLDGPSEADIAAAQAADLIKARHDAALEALRLRRCRDLNGPRAEVILAGIDGQDYVCRVPARSAP